jgi:hypothetical protein
VEGIGVEDNFFELGGHSLLAAQLMCRIRETFKLRMAVRTIFDAPILKDFVSQLEAQVRVQEHEPIPNIVPAARDTEIPLSYAQQRLWFLHQLEPSNPAYNISAAIQIKGDLDLEALEWSISEVVRRHESLRTRFVTINGLPRQVITDPGRWPVPVVDLKGIGNSDAEAGRLARQEAATPFVLSEGPLLRTTLLRLSPHRYTLVVTMHHIVSDGWSTGILVREFEQLYGRYANGDRTSLPALTVQYADFAVWEREYLQDEVLEKQLKYWRQQLSGMPLLKLPRKLNSTGASVTVAVEVFRLGKTLKEAVSKLGMDREVTLFMMLLGILNVILHYLTGSVDIGVATDVANRNHPQVHGLIGFFVNQVALRTSLRNNPTFSELLRRIRETCLQAYEHQNLPFDRLVEELNPERDSFRSPLFQVKLVLQNVPHETAAFPGLDLRVMPSTPQAGKFDFMLTFQEEADDLLGTLEYDTEVLEREMILNVVELFTVIANEVMVRPELTLGELVAFMGRHTDQQWRKKGEQRRTSFQASFDSLMRRRLTTATSGDLYTSDGT